MKAILSKYKYMILIGLVTILVSYGIKIYQDYQFNKASQSLSKTKDKSNDIKNNVEKYEIDAANSIKIANEAQKRIGVRNNSTVLDLDWNKNER